MCQLKLAFLLIKIQPLEEAGVELTRKDYKSLQNKTEIAKIINSKDYCNYSGQP